MVANLRGSREEEEEEEEEEKRARENMRTQEIRRSEKLNLVMGFWISKIPKMVRKTILTMNKKFT